MKTIRIVVADDHAVVREGLLGILARCSQFEVVGTASDGHAAIEQIALKAPDVALLDLRMPGVDGFEATRALRRRGVATRVLILTIHESDADVLAALDAGAHGYVLKDVLPEELFAAVRAVAEGRRALSPRVAAMLAARKPPVETLSARELQVLGLVARGASNKTIGAELLISEATVKTHMLHIFAKLGVDDRTAAVTQAVHRGLLRLDLCVRSP